ncbi:MAG: twin-arginine translocase TatA/TatE family subunit [Prevotellaceae bacterium]|jgi:sec-independent protein translocase protein TatA|nr:twin-arginine translocase TatA/TatE family subunit [Prevotellaceae bacterium]
MTTFLVFGLGTGEIIGIAALVLLLFGGKKIPELMRGLGKGVKSFKEGVKGIESDITASIESDTDSSIAEKSSASETSTSDNTSKSDA